MNNAPSEPEHKGWYSRGYLPHFDNPGLVQAITFRLADAMPSTKLAQWRELAVQPRNPTLREQVESYLDAGHGSCCLKQENVARLVENALLHFDGERYRLLAWVVMPNHVHVLVETFDHHALGRVVHAWKSYTSHRVGDLLGRKGRIWQPEYYDRFIRNETHLMAAIRYIHENPVKAGLVACANQWPFGSARFGGALGAQTLEAQASSPASDA